MLKNPVFLYRFKIHYQKFLMFLSFIIVTGFMNIFGSSRSQVLFKISALKNFAIFWIKKRFQHRCFSVNIAKLLKTAFLQNFSGGYFCILKSNQAAIWQRCVCITANGNILASGNLCFRVFNLQLKVINKNFCYLYSVWVNQIN